MHAIKGLIAQFLIGEEEDVEVVGEGGEGGGVAGCGDGGEALVAKGRGEGGDPAWGEGVLMVFGEVWGGDLPLLSNARLAAFERLGECGDGVESGGREGGIGEEGAVGCHVVFAPLEVAAWFFGEKEVLGYRFRKTKL